MVPLDYNPQSVVEAMRTLKTKDDVLTLLIHLGYLAYDPISLTESTPQALEGYTGGILLVGINYDRKNRNKTHRFVVDRIEKTGN